jgi:Fanconi anemia group M protein|tara:strand:- start:76 stop:732 length:657 start_codon:yes stop_codon:yes gene_type:complete
MQILMDHRERPSGIKKELIKQNMDVIEKTLISADFIIKTKDLHGKILTIGIEKKTINDFLNSIIDKRIISQLIEMKRHFDLQLLIIEGTDNIYEIRNFHPNSIRGMLASIAIDFQTPILHTRNHRDTANLLSIIAKRLEKPRSLPSLLKKRKPLTQKQQQEFLVESLPGIGPLTSRELLKKFKTIKDLVNAKESDLKKVKKIGKIKAQQLKKLFEKKY